MSDTKQSEEQARAQLASICEMVDALTLDGAAQAYAKGLTREELEKVLIENEVIEDNPSEDGTEQDDETLREKLVEALTARNADPEAFGLEWDEEKARETIQDDPLSVLVRSGWYSPGESDVKAEEFEILLCTGGPAVRIRGELDEHLEPHRCWLEHQDWGTPWTQLFGVSEDEQEKLLAYARCFYFGE